MALIRCPECKRKVSDQADSCPSCGYPISFNLDATGANYGFVESAEVKKDSMAKRIAKKHDKNNHKIAILPVAFLVGVFLCLFGVGAYIAFWPQINTEKAYQAAVTLMDQGMYQDALPRFEQLDTYKDSPEYINVCKFQLALEMEEAERYIEAADAYKALGDYVHRYKQPQNKPISAADKAEEMAERAKVIIFHQIAQDVIAKAASSYATIMRDWHISMSNFDFAIGQWDYIVVMWYQRASYGSRRTDKDRDYSTGIKLSDYEDLMDLYSGNYEKAKTDWLKFMKEHYKGMSKTIR